jgi:hypothetical protein
MTSIVQPFSPPFSEQPPAAALPLDSGFDARWDAWMMRGKAHEHLVRRKLTVAACLLTTGTAIVYVLLG